jgi:thiamine biosynthesis protein ThiS
MVSVNGERREVAPGAAITELIMGLGLKTDLIAVEVNKRIVRKSNWGSTFLSEGDRVEIVHFVGGGVGWE